jgi:hypothetical protein
VVGARSGRLEAPSFPPPRDEEAFPTMSPGFEALPGSPWVRSVATRPFRRLEVERCSCAQAGPKLLYQAATSPRSFRAPGTSL